MRSHAPLRAGQPVAGDGTRLAGGHWALRVDGPVWRGRCRTPTRWAPWSALSRSTSSPRSPTSSGPGGSRSSPRGWVAGAPA
ncbi:hypothetical protein [Actinomycetospora sp. CA-053990]|uniref:hypothetical protein n=1 Tax=Actinomycetospora sp. CA-053990 TaxID=3239891 RepID=UPI003D91B510